MYFKTDVYVYAPKISMVVDPTDPATDPGKSLMKFPSLRNGAISMTAYGIWYNAERQNYTIVGGYSKVDSKGISTAYLVDWDPVNGFSNFSSVYFNNDASSSRHSL